MKNNKTLIIIAAIVGILLLLAIPTCSTYNSMVTLNEDAEQSWGEVQNQYQRRFDLIPNLVATVKAYAKHESETLQGVTNARAGITPTDTTALMNAANEAMNAPDANAYANALKKLTAEMSKFSINVNAVHEAYPELKASENFSRLQDELAGTENRVEMARNKYTQTVKDYNIKIKRFPANIVAGMFGFEPRQQYEAEQAAQKAPNVNDAFNQ
ncbi:MAG: LemA family protein [Paramuribaculum sp.]